MTKCYLDSNVIIYLKDEQSIGYNRSREIIETLVKQKIEMYISPLCVDEFLHEFGKALRSKIPANDFFISLEKALSSILSLPYLSVVNPPVDRASHKKIVSIMKTFALRPRDAYHLLTMQAHGIDGFATFDTDFEKVFAAKLLESM